MLQKYVDEIPTCPKLMGFFLVKYMQNSPDGCKRGEIERMRDNDLLN